MPSRHTLASAPVCPPVCPHEVQGPSFGSHSARRPAPSSRDRGHFEARRGARQFLSERMTPSVRLSQARHPGGDILQSVRRCESETRGGEHRITIPLLQSETRSSLLYQRDDRRRRQLGSALDGGGGERLQRVTARRFEVRKECVAHLRRYSFCQQDGKQGNLGPSPVSRRRRTGRPPAHERARAAVPQSLDSEPEPSSPSLAISVGCYRPRQASAAAAAASEQRATRLPDAWTHPAARAVGRPAPRHRAVCRANATCPPAPPRCCRPERPQPTNRKTASRSQRSWSLSHSSFDGR